MLARLGVTHRAHASPAELSGGEAQRVALARALVHEPAVLLLDEPLSGVDVQARPSIRSILRRELAAFDGVRIIVTHDPVEAMTLGDLLVVMESGRVTQSGTPDEIRAAPRTPYAAAVVGLNLFRGRLEQLEPGTGLLRTADGEVVVPWPAGIDGPVADALGLLRPSDVALYRARPEGSARNVVPGRIEAISMEPDRARVRIASAPPLVAEVTAGSVQRLGLKEGVEVWSSFKAMEVTVVVP
jgi:molybdate transport system ATP-binding protein